MYTIVMHKRNRYARCNPNRYESNMHFDTVAEATRALLDAVEEQKRMAEFQVGAAGYDVRFREELVRNGYELTILPETPSIAGLKLRYTIEPCREPGVQMIDM